MDRAGNVAALDDVEFWETIAGTRSSQHVLEVFDESPSIVLARIANVHLRPCPRSLDRPDPMSIRQVRGGAGRTGVLHAVTADYSGPAAMVTSRTGQLVATRVAVP